MPTPSGTHQAILNFTDTTILDSRTGASLGAAETGQYGLSDSISQGVAITTSTSNIYLANYQNPDFAGVSISSGKILWTVTLPAWLKNSGTPSFDTDGSSYVAWTETGAVRYDFRTGVQQQVFKAPAGLSCDIANATYIVCGTKSTLSLYSWNTLSSPVWSVAAAGVNPLAITPSNVVVAAEAGVKVLSTKDGSIVGSVPDGVELSRYSDSVDGYRTVGSVSDADTPSAIIYLP